jgi:hypothetical protein
MKKGEPEQREEVGREGRPSARQTVRRSSCTLHWTEIDFDDEVAELTIFQSLLKEPILISVT